MLTNDDMKAGRFLKLAKGRKIFKAIQDCLAVKGGEVTLTTYTRHTIFDTRHRDLFVIGKTGSLYVKRGKSLDCIDGCAIRIYPKAA